MRNLVKEFRYLNQSPSDDFPSLVSKGGNRQGTRLSSRDSLSAHNKNAFLLEKRSIYLSINLFRLNHVSLSVAYRVASRVILCVGMMDAIAIVTSLLLSSDNLAYYLD